MPAFLLYLFRLAYFLPVIIAAAFVSIVWGYFYGDDLGVINYYLIRLGFSPVHWLTSSRTAMMSIVIMDVWKNAGFFMIIFIAALQGVPKDADRSGGHGRRFLLAPVLPHRLALDFAGRLLRHRLRVDRRAAGVRVDRHSDPRRSRRRNPLDVDLHRRRGLRQFRDRLRRLGRRRHDRGDPRNNRVAILASRDWVRY